MASPISWTTNQLKRLRDAVRAYNRTRNMMERTGNYDYVPNPTEFEKEKSRIRTRDQLRQRVRELNRILKKNKPDSWDVVRVVTEDYETINVPKYLKDEIRNSGMAANERRRELRETLYGDFESLTTIEQATRMANKNIRDIDYEGYYTPDDYDELLSDLYPDTAEYMERYISVWEDMGGDSDTADIIRQIADENPDAIKEIFESKSSFIDIDYIYPSKNDFGPYRNRKNYQYANKGSADMTPMERRYQNVSDFWREKKKEYLG